MQQILSLFSPASFAALICAVLGASADALGEVAHRWTDADGVTHFSDVPPQSDAVTVERIDLYDFPPPADVTADYFSVVNQWERMRAEREARESRRIARERLESERRRLELEAAYREDAGTVVDQRVPVYASPWLLPGGYGFNGRPGHRPYDSRTRRDRGHRAERPQGTAQHFDHRFNATPSAFGRHGGRD